jgi:hypothetical protein
MAGFYLEDHLQLIVCKVDITGKCQVILMKHYYFMMKTRLGKKNITPIRNVITLFFVMTFTLVFFIESSTASVCFCGRCFPSGPQDSKLKINSAFDKNPSGKNYRICHLINGKSFIRICPDQSVSKIKTCFSPITCNSQNCSSLNLSRISLRFIDNCEAFQHQHLYLKNLSLRC